jgi:hypothetical protein
MGSDILSELLEKKEVLLLVYVRFLVQIGRLTEPNRAVGRLVFLIFIFSHFTLFLSFVFPRLFYFNFKFLCHTLTGRI